MRLAVMQPYFMPYIGYFQAIGAVDKYILYGNLPFIKKQWMNRNRIRLCNGEVYPIIVPLKHKSSKTLIHDVVVDNSQPWERSLLKTLLMNYKRAYGFNEVFPFIESLLSIRYETLMELNVETIRSISRYLDIQTEIDSDNRRFDDLEEVLKSIESDYSNLPYLWTTKPVKKTARVIEICRREHSCHYINAIGGQALYDKNEFLSYGIRLDFIRTNEITYPQYSYPFEPNLSIIDVLMHNGKEGTKELLKEYTLI